MSSQPQVAKLAPDLVKGVTGLARSLVAASRNWTLYPPEHPAVRASFERLSQTIQDATNDAVFSVGITSDNLMIESFPVPDNPQVVEAARLLHDRDLLRLTFSGRVPAVAVSKLLRLLALDRATLRSRGGPEGVWRKDGDVSIALEQIDYVHVLEDKDVQVERKQDDVWKSIVQSIVTGRKTMDEVAQRRLLAIAGGTEQIGELAHAVLIIDLLRLERDAARAAEIADDMTALAEDLLMAGDYTEARDVAKALRETSCG